MRKPLPLPKRPLLKMRILIYGAGVIGSIFAVKLALSGNEITVLARSRRYAELEKNGILLVNPQTQRIEKTQVKVIDQLLSDMKFDYIIVTLQGTQVSEVLPVLAKNCTANIVFAVNTAKGYEEWAAAVGRERLMIGFPSAGGERRDGMVSYFVGKGMQRLFQTTTFGEYNGCKSDRVRTLIRLFNRAGIPSVFSSDMDAWQKTHVAMVTNIANALYGFGCNNYELGKSYKDVNMMIRGIKEGRKVLRKCKIKPAPRKLWWFNLPSPLLTVVFQIFMKTKLAETTMAKHCIAAKSELILLQQEFNRLIEDSGIPVPVIRTLEKNLFRAE